MPPDKLLTVVAPSNPHFKVATEKGWTYLTWMAVFSEGRWGQPERNNFEVGGHGGIPRLNLQFYRMAVFYEEPGRYSIWYIYTALAKEWKPNVSPNFAPREISWNFSIPTPAGLKRMVFSSKSSRLIGFFAAQPLVSAVVWYLLELWAMALWHQQWQKKPCKLGNTETVHWGFQLPKSNDKNQNLWIWTQETNHWSWMKLVSSNQSSRDGRRANFYMAK